MPYFVFGRRRSGEKGGGESFIGWLSSLPVLVQAIVTLARCLLGETRSRSLVNSIKGALKSKHRALNYSFRWILGAIQLEALPRA
jgi:hypothetical protein